MIGCLSFVTVSSHSHTAILEGKMRGLVRTTTVVAAVGVFLLLGLPGEAQKATPDPQSPKLKPLPDQQRIQGKWKPVSVRDDGKDIDSQKRDVTITFSGSTMAMLGSRRTYKPEFTLDPTKTPHQIDLKFQGEGGTTVVAKGIYRFEGDNLQICTEEIGCPRPTEFETKVGDKRSLMVLSRVTEGVSGLPGEAQEAVTIQQSPELKVLGRYVGSWQWQVVSKPAEWTPDKTMMTSTAKVEWTLRGRMIQDKGVMSPGNLHALTLMAYDSENKVYKLWWFDSNGNIPRGENRGRWDEATQTLTWKESWPNGITITRTDRFIGKDMLERTMVFKDRTGKVLMDVEAKAKRK